MAAGALAFAGSVLLSMIPSLAAVSASLAGVCAGFFVVHSSAVGALNRKLESSRGRANSLYVLFYYLGGTAGITGTSGAFTSVKTTALLTAPEAIKALKLAAETKSAYKPPAR